jgi:hypothetical protein
MTAPQSNDPPRRAGSTPPRAVSNTSPNDVDGGHPASIHSPSPIADWLDFLADLIAAEIVREWEDGGSTE